MGLMHMQRTQPETGSIVYIQAHFDLSGLISKARKRSAQSYDKLIRHIYIYFFDKLIRQSGVPEAKFNIKKLCI